MSLETKVSTFLPSPVLTVSELNREVKRTIETRFGELWVTGEITGFTAASSGHWYFSLKDSRSQVRCAMFRNRNYKMSWTPKNGDAIEILCSPSLYEPRGEFQLTVNDMRRAGLGALFEAFQALKEKLSAEGLFDPEKKRRTPDYPRRIAVITSPGAAALRDVVTTLNRRVPHVASRLYPSLVQGVEAPRNLISALERVKEDAWADLVILCRGGGSMEDLWAFNDEALARAIRAFPIPVISGVGHETDFTIADFSADVRAPTPTAAAELAARATETLKDTLMQAKQRLSRPLHLKLERGQRQIESYDTRLKHRMERLMQQHAITLDRLKSRLIDPKDALNLRRKSLEALIARFEQQHPKRALSDKRRALAVTSETIQRLWQLKIATERRALESRGNALLFLNPTRVLERGYSLVFTAEGTLVKDEKDVVTSDPLTVQFAKNTLKVKPLL